jgi:D-3-phosphoglycerate dehydrogenase
MYTIRPLNHIAPKGLARLPETHYRIDAEADNPDAILVRSYKMHDMELPSNLVAVGRAGAGVNNIPVDQLTARGIPVFNAPGANANAVKELVLAGMLLGARNLCQAWDYARNLTGEDPAVHQAVESGKKQFAGFELPGRTLGVIGLGAIGVQVANAARTLGMHVIGYDPGITVDRAWQLSADVQQAQSLDELLPRVDFLTLHVPLSDNTRHLINSERLHAMPDGTILLNFSRSGIVDDDAVAGAVEAGKLRSYICDFPTNLLKNHPGVITLPHLGASTQEAEENCAVMVADQVREYLEQGTVSHSVNFPDIVLPRKGDVRLAVVNANRPNMLGQISHDLGEAGVNIVHMNNESQDRIACTLIDVEGDVSDATLEMIRNTEGVIRARRL